MKAIFTTTALASLLVAGGLLVSQPATAQDNGPCVGDNCSTMQDGQNGTKKRMKSIDQDNQGTDESTDQLPTRKKRMQGSSNDNDMNESDMPRKKRSKKAQQNDDVNVDVDVRTGSNKRARRGDWKYDSNRHHRRRSKNATYRFYLDGFWYDQPYWDVYVRPGRVSCGEGREIVAERFNRVRVVECNGGTYTYLGRRDGDTYRIKLNARTGRVVGRGLI